MTLVRFNYECDIITGFVIEGHATSSAKDEEGRLVCSAVSSAAYMTANTITDVVGAKADIHEDEAKMRLTVLEEPEQCQTILQGFYIHIEHLAKQYKKHLKVISEV